MECQLLFQEIMFYTLYGSVAALSLVACIYLLLRRANAFFPEITPPVRLRRWAAAFFAVIALAHVWWLLLYFSCPCSDSSINVLICMLLDSLTILPTLLCTMLVMLQDRKRSFWPFAVVILISLSTLFVTSVFNVYNRIFLLTSYLVRVIYVTWYMLHALREYRLWLRENYADLEHKEVWQSFVLLAVFMLAGICYNINASSLMYEIVMQLIDIILIFVLLWRVETLQTLETHDSENTDASAPMNAVFTKIESALQLHCVESQLYLRHDVSLSHLAQIIGTNSKYLSQYFAHQGLTYNAYINGLRIKYFINHYKEANANKLFVTANQLASESGFRSYSTFSAAFKQYMGQPVTAWMRDNV